MGFCVGDPDGGPSRVKVACAPFKLPLWAINHNIIRLNWRPEKFNYTGQWTSRNQGYAPIFCRFVAQEFV